MEQIKTKAYGAKASLIDSLSSLSRMDIERYEPKSDEVQIDILCCGVCHRISGPIRRASGPE